MNIQKLLESGANVTVSVTPADLKEFALELIKEAMDEGAKRKEPERYLTGKETADKLNVSENTLWRWKKSKYLVPHKVGNTVYYKLSEIEQLLEGRK